MLNKLGQGASVCYVMELQQISFVKERFNHMSKSDHFIFYVIAYSQNVYPGPLPKMHILLQRGDLNSTIVLFRCYVELFYNKSGHQVKPIKHTILPSN